MKSAEPPVTGGVKPALLVTAKSPLPGKAKTRLCPPCSPEQAAAVAEASLRDTLACAVASPVFARVVVALDGDPGAWLEDFPGIETFAQEGGDFGARLQHAWESCGGPALQIGMDTPQVSPSLLAGCVGALSTHDAALGMAADGGWWALALRCPQPAMFDCVPMSSPDTGSAQLRRLEALGMAVATLPVLTDIDSAHDAVAVAATLPGSRLAAAVSSIAALRDLRDLRHTRLGVPG